MKDLQSTQNLIEYLSQPENEIDNFYFNKSYLTIIDDLNTSIVSYIRHQEQEVTRLKKTDTFRQEFVANVSHELKTPIFSAQGYIDTLIDGAIYDTKVRKKFLLKAMKNLENLGFLLEDLLILSQAESGKIKINMQIFDIKKITNEIFENIEGMGYEKHKRLRFVKNTAKSVFVFGDKKLIYHVLQNLISNGLKYTKVGGLIEVGLKSQKDNKILIMVRDNGIGIPSHEINRIFERFYRIEKSRNRDKGGTGLGLSIVKYILEAHNSKIKLKSKEDVGSLFYFTLDASH